MTSIAPTFAKKKVEPNPILLAAFDKRFQRISAQVMFHHGIFAQAHMKLIRVLVDNTHFVKTAGTDGKYVWFNAEYLMPLTDAELLFIVLHEYLHCMLLHMLRRGARDGRVFNIAGDAIINALLELYQQERKSEFARITMPKEGIRMPEYKDWDVVSLYNELMKDEPCEGDEPGEDTEGEGEGEGPGGNADGEPCEDGEGNGPEGKPDDRSGGKGKPKRKKADNVKGKALDDVMAPGNAEGQAEDEKRGDDGGTGTPQEQQAGLERDWNDLLTSSVQMAKMQGKCPGCFAALVEARDKPPSNWYERVMDFFSARAPVEESWSKFNRRFMGSGTYLPGMDGVKVEELVIGSDASGSVSDQEFAIVMGVLNDAFDELKPERIHVTQWDYNVSDAACYGPDDMPLPAVRRKGYGGTDPEAFFRWVKDTLPDTEIVVCITDGEFGMPEKPEGLDVLWLVTRPQIDHFTWGTVVYCPISQ